MDPFDHDLERGLRNRRAILGDAWVDQATSKSSEFNADFQNLITRFAWHEIWGRPGLDLKTRRIIVLAITTALGRWEEYDLHLRASLAATDASRLTPDDVKEVLMQSAIYAGVPAANTAFSHAKAILAELGMLPGARSAAEVSHPGVGRSLRTSGSPALHVTVREPRSGHARHTVVLSHALGCDQMMWDALANGLAQDHRVICYDHRGHGDSAVPAGPYALAQLADDAARVIEQVAQGPVVFIGLSMGGMVAQELALRHPSLVKALIIANSSSGYPPEARAQWDQRIEAIRKAGLESIVDGAMLRWFGEAFRMANPATVARWRRRVASQDAAGYIAACEAVRDLDTTSRLPGIQAPTLVIAGELDPGTPVAMSELIASAIPGARLHVLPGASHLSVIEQPAEFEAAVRSHLATI